MAKLRFPLSVSLSMLVKKFSISSCVKNVTSRSFVFIKSIVVGSRQSTSSFLRNLSQDRIVIICAFTVLVDKPPSASDKRHSSKSFFVIFSIRISGTCLASSISGDFQFFARDGSIGGRKIFAEIWVFSGFSGRLDSRIFSIFGSIQLIKRQIWNAYCSWVFRERHLCSRKYTRKLLKASRIFILQKYAIK